MKKNLFMTAAAIAALLTGCSTDEEIANIETSAKNAIGFNIVSNSAETKATIYNNGSTNFDFDVFAFNSTTGDLFMGDHPQESYAHNGVDIYHNGSEWGYRNSNELAYWPSDESKLSFYAISPATVAQDMLQFYMWNIHGPKSDKGNKIFCSLVDEYGNTGTNYDLMYATAFNYDKTINNTKVKLSFKHTLSQVIFKGTTSNASLKADIKSIRMYNIKYSGNFSIPADLQAGSNNYARAPKSTDWTLNETKHSVAAKMAGDNVLVDNTGVKDLSKSDEPILVIPQVLTPWSTTTSIDDDNSYLEISMKLTQNGQYVIGTESRYQTIYVPFINVDSNNTTGWEPGKCYIYTLTFGGGYDKNGKPILTPITFEPSVEDWVDASGYNVQL